jgi:holo-[acyl-carrier protein] synthase
MITGVGTDLIHLDRIEKVQLRSKQRFARKVLGDQEYAVWQSRTRLDPHRGLRYLAGRFAAKEALCKALGIGFRAPMRWHDFQLLNQENGQPVWHFTGAVAYYIQQRQLTFHTSLSDDGKMLISFVVAEKPSASSFSSSPSTQ